MSCVDLELLNGAINEGLKASVSLYVIGGKCFLCMSRGSENTWSYM